MNVDFLTGLTFFRDVLDETINRLLNEEKEAPKTAKGLEAQCERVVDAEHLKSLVSKLVAAKKSAEVKEIFASLGAARVSELAPEHYAEVVEKLEALRA